MNKDLLLQKEFNLLSVKQQIQRGLKITKDLIAGTQESAQITIPDDLQSFTVLNLEVSPFPTQSRKVMKYIETESLQKFANKNQFVKVGNYCIAFVNVEDLSYHNFENILNLDHLFDQVEFQITSKQLVESKNIQIFNLKGSTKTLLSLDKLNYYTIPLNNEQRGGKRMIFHSNQLSMALTQMIAKSDFFDKKKFSHVNNVFRLNNFAPGDKKFKAHYDTPFADKSKNLFSKYTMLIYLTGNRSRKRNGQIPPLKIEDFEIQQINENDCVIFDQKCEHEGNAFEANNKIFIRTELIYKMKDYEYDEKIARMFNMACYMTKEVGQQQYSADLFNNCVKMRHQIALDKTPEVLLVKRNVNAVYVTNGNDYWFSEKIDLKLIAFLIILDYFNGKMKDLNNVKIDSEVFPRELIKGSEENDDKVICNFIKKKRGFEFNLDSIQRDYEQLSKFIPNKFEGFHNHYKNYIKQCICENSGGFYIGDITQKEVFEAEKYRTQKRLLREFNKTSVMIFDREIAISYDKIKIQMDDDDHTNNNNNKLKSGKIRLSDFYINPEKQIHFAGSDCYCQYKYHKNEVVFLRTKRVNTFCLPDISFQYLPNGVKLSIDIFNNGFVYSSAITFKQPYSDEDKTKALAKQRRIAKLKEEHSDSYNNYDNDDSNDSQFMLDKSVYEDGSDFHCDDNDDDESENNDSCIDDQTESSNEDEEEEEDEEELEEKEEEDESQEQEDELEEEEYESQEQEDEDELEEEEDEPQEQEDELEDDEINSVPENQMEQEESSQNKSKLQSKSKKVYKTKKIKTIRKSLLKKIEKRRVHSYNLRSQTKLKKTND